VADLGHEVFVDLVVADAMILAARTNLVLEPALAVLRLVFVTSFVCLGFLV
jgi:hypothetical protein